jgi:uncharacterized iron-regulated protein
LGVHIQQVRSILSAKVVSCGESWDNQSSKSLNSGRSKNLKEDLRNHGVCSMNMMKTPHSNGGISPYVLFFR